MQIQDMTFELNIGIVCNIVITTISVKSRLIAPVNVSEVVPRTYTNRAP